MIEKITKTQQKYFKHFNVVTNDRVAKNVISTLMLSNEPITILDICKITGFSCYRVARVIDNMYHIGLLKEN